MLLLRVTPITVVVMRSTVTAASTSTVLLCLKLVSVVLDNGRLEEKANLPLRLLYLQWRF